MREADVVLKWPRLTLALLIISPIALGVHSYMLDVLLIPFPQRSGVPVWATCLNIAGSTIAYLFFCHFAQTRLSRRHVWRILTVVLIYCGLRATLRLFFINSYLTGAWAYQSLTSLDRVIEFTFIVGMIVTASPVLRSAKARIAGGLVIALLVTALVRPGLELAFTPMFHAIASLNYPEFRLPPYTLQDNLVIYGTYLETTLACFAIAYLVWPSLATNPGARLAQFATLIMFMKQSIVPTLLFSFHEPLPWPQAVLSEAQFALETLTLALLTGLAWPFVYRSAPACGTASAEGKR